MGRYNDYGSDESSDYEAIRYSRTESVSTRLRPRTKTRKICYADLDESDPNPSSDADVPNGDVDGDACTTVILIPAIERFLRREKVNPPPAHDQADSNQPTTATEPTAAPLTSAGCAYRYQVKYRGLSYNKCQWLSESQLDEHITNDKSLRAKLNHFRRKIDSGGEVPEATNADIPEVDRALDCSDLFRALYPSKAAQLGRSEWHMYCMRIVDALVCFQRKGIFYGIPFLRPIDEELHSAPRYSQIIQRPMDFTTIQTKLYLKVYQQPQEFWLDVKQIVHNCRLYNNSETDVYVQANLIEKLFDKLYAEWARLSRQAAQLQQKRSDETGIPQQLTIENLPIEGTDIPLPEVLEDNDVTPEMAVQHITFRNLLECHERQSLYFVKWKNQSYNDATWERVEDIFEGLKIAQFHRITTVPEALLAEFGIKGPGFWEADLQKKMLQQTFLYIKAAQEVLRAGGLPSMGMSSMTRILGALPRLTHAHDLVGATASVGAEAVTKTLMAADEPTDEKAATAPVPRPLRPEPLQRPRMPPYHQSFGHHPPYGFGCLDTYAMSPFGAFASPFNPMMAPQRFSPLQLGVPSGMSRSSVVKGIDNNNSRNSSRVTSRRGSETKVEGDLETGQQILADASKVIGSGGAANSTEGGSLTPPRLSVVKMTEGGQSAVNSVATVTNVEGRPAPVVEAPTEGAACEAPTEGAACEAPTEGAVVVAPTEGAACEASTEGAACEASTECAACEAPTEGAGVIMASEPQDDEIRPFSNNEETSAAIPVPEAFPVPVVSAVAEPVVVMAPVVPEPTPVVPMPVSEMVEAFQVGLSEKLDEVGVVELVTVAPVESAKAADEPVMQMGKSVPMDVYSIALDSGITFTKDCHVAMVDSTDVLSGDTAEISTSSIEATTGPIEITSKVEPTPTGESTSSSVPVCPDHLEASSVDTGSGHLNAALENQVKCEGLEERTVSNEAIECVTKKSLDEVPRKTDPKAASKPESTGAQQAILSQTGRPKISIKLSMDTVYSGPAAMAANSPVAEQFAELKKPRGPPTGCSRKYVTTPIFKSGLKLFDYQLDGLNWMLHLWEDGRNGVLADEMGLGKTIQTMAFFWHLHYKERYRGPFLVIAPLSTLDHWKTTADLWTDMNVVLYYDEGGRQGRDNLRNHEWFHHALIETAGQSSKASLGFPMPAGQSYKEPRVTETSHYKFQLLVTSYETFLADTDLLAQIPWQYVVVDEAHKLKNRLSKMLQCLRQNACRHILLLTGTPVQNNTEELWPLLNYIEPVRFCDVEAFKMEFGELSTPQQVENLTKLLRPHMLRRVKEDVAHSIPPLEETIIDVELTTLQKAYYRAIFERNLSVLSKMMTNAPASQMPRLMNVEMELRKCCNHPFMINGVEYREYATCRDQDERYKKLVESSGKMVLLEKLLPKLRDENHKVLIFSQFTRTLTLIEELLQNWQWRFERLDGSVRGQERAAAISRFNDATYDRFVFLLSTRAGGLGINLTSADHVIIFDSDWNPQNDIQATARAHRIGQEREVKVYRLITARTYEAEMFERASKKLGLNTAVFHRGAFGTNEDGKSDAAAVPTSSTPSRSEIEGLLKNGAYYFLDKQGAEASQQFQESNIEDILSNNTRLVRYQITGQSSTFAKTSFRSEMTSDIRIDDPDFWKKVLNDSSSQMLLARLNDGSAVASNSAKELYLKDLKRAVKTIAAEDAPQPIIQALVQVTNQRDFSSRERSKAEEWLQTAQATLASLGVPTQPSPRDEENDAVQSDDDESGHGLRRSTRLKPEGTLFLEPDEGASLWDSVKNLKKMTGKGRASKKSKPSSKKRKSIGSGEEAPPGSSLEEEDESIEAVETKKANRSRANDLTAKQLVAEMMDAAGGDEYLVFNSEESDDDRDDKPYKGKQKRRKPAAKKSTGATKKRKLKQSAS